MKCLSTIPCLSEDIVNSILLQLPVKSLLRFKLTCKSWCCCIDDPYFIKSHLHKSSTNIRRQNFLFFDINSEENLPNHYSIKVLSIEASINDDSKVVSLDQPNIPKFSDHVHYLHMSSCSGLVLIYNPWNSLILWNPVNGKYKQLPMPHLLKQKPTSWYGIAYDFVAEDYKVLCIHEEVTMSHRNEIYSVKNKSWRTIDTILPYSKLYMYHNSPISLNGAIHIMGHTGKCIFVVISFRLADEKFIIMPVPSKCGNYMELNAFGGLVSVFSWDGKEISIWSLEEDRKTDALSAWNYITKFPTEFTLISVPYPRIWLYICVKDNGNILWRDEDASTFIEYDVRTNKYAAFTLKDMPLCRGNKTLFVESLLSLKIPWD